MMLVKLIGIALIGVVAVSVLRTAKPVSYTHLTLPTKA